MDEFGSFVMRKKEGGNKLKLKKIFMLIIVKKLKNYWINILREIFFKLFLYFCNVFNSWIFR